ncbi:MAG: hypothetical protein E7444_08115 [Ruminococcaceae bacterium]|nr:hypothetical protein [Oscillospiraceae bacterium]
MKKQNKEKPSVNLGAILIRVAAGLFILTMISIYLLSGLFARYVSSGHGSDSARVATFGALTLTETGDFDGTLDKKGMIIPGVSLTKNATVTFTGSEMATVVFVEVIVPKDTWERADNSVFSYGGLSWSVASGWDYLGSDNYDGNIRHIYFKILEPNEELNSEPIVTDGKIFVSEEITKANIGSLANADLTFRASVIQAGGFKTVQEAWTAMAAK